ncbi:DctP family TRAP transporter solute-binding subunit [Hyphomicrobiales bacterium]|nr:DctP family TRAP transporter solute-binding subunit [Hyphomicrobiales bacterium]CAH1674938.1 DctP family TRAP transporter solute-binding subunit [Hyphomicrobiales bacterium]
MLRNKTFAVLAGVLAVAMPLGGGASAQVQDRSIRVGSTLSPEHPNGIAIKAMAACAAKQSDGKIKIQGIYNAALGGDQEMSQAARAGTLDMFTTTTSPLVGLEPKLGVFDLPFLFNNRDEALAVLDGPFGKTVSDLMPARGLVNLSFWDYGFRQITNSKRPIKAVDDLRGIRLRVIQNNIFIDAFSTLGANPIPMSWGEVFPALETGAIDGQENPVLTISDAQLSDVQKYLSRTNHVYSALMVVYSKALWDKLSADEQKIIQACANEAKVIQREEMGKRADQAYAKLQKDGMAINDVDPATLDDMRKRLAPLYEKYAASIGKDMIDGLNAQVAEVRKK